MNKKINISINPEIFRAYDIRGVVGRDLRPEIVEILGLAIGSEVKHQGENTVIVARDGRLSGAVFAESLKVGILRSGCDVIDIGAVPTPLLYFATHTLSYTSGVMLTGSHNPSEYNGLKIIIAGKTLSEKEIKHLHELIKRKNYTYGIGRARSAIITDKYINYVAKDIKLKKSLKVVVDAGNGIAGVVAPLLFRELGCEVVELYCDVDGNFPNHHPDPSCKENLIKLSKTVIEANADVGFAFDGDGDRLGVVTNMGNMITPDRQMMLFAIDILEQKGCGVILYDVKCTKNLHTVIKKHGGQPIMSKTGHSFVKFAIYETNALFGGEMSGHLFFNDRWFGFDDGIYAAARLLEILSKTDISIDDIFSKLPNSVTTPELKVYISDNEKFCFVNKFKEKANFEGAKKITIDGIRVEFSNCWGLIRASNTTPSLSFRFEADDECSLKWMQKKFREELLKIDSKLKLPF